MIDRDEALWIVTSVVLKSSMLEDYERAERIVDAILALERPPVVTDEMAARLHDTLRAHGWSDLHTYWGSGMATQDLVRAALEAALREGSDE